MSDKHDPKRRYFDFDPRQGYPAGDALYFECTACGGSMPSLPPESTQCACGNLAIDVDYGRVSVRDHSKMQIFSEDP
jgi:hypothetical protein